MRRFLRAFLLAPLAAPTIFWAWYGIAGLLGGEDRRRAVLDTPFRELGDGRRLRAVFPGPLDTLAHPAGLA